MRRFSLYFGLGLEISVGCFRGSRFVCSKVVKLLCWLGGENKLEQEFGEQINLDFRSQVKESMFYFVVSVKLEGLFVQKSEYGFVLGVLNCSRERKRSGS